MAEEAKRSLNPYTDMADSELNDFYDRFSGAYLGLKSMKGVPQDSLLHQLDLAGEERKRRIAMRENPKKESSINEISAKRTQEILDGNEYRKRHNLSHSGFDKEHRPWVFTGSAYSDHDELVKLLRKVYDSVSEKESKTAEWLSKFIKK